MQFNRWKLALGGGLCLAAVIGLGVQSVRNVHAADDQEDAIRKALDNLKNGPGPKEEKKEKAEDLNPVDALRQHQEALKDARKRLQEDPNDEQAKKDVEDLQKKVADAMRNNNRLAPQIPNFPMLPIQPIDPAEFDKLVEQQQKMIEEMLRQMQVPPQQRMMFMNGNRLGFGLGGARVRPGDLRLGIRMERPSPVLAEQLGLTDNQGIVIAEVYPGTPAEKAGLKANDILLEVAGKPVSSEMGDLQQMLREIKAEDNVDLVVMRKGKKETIKGVSMPARQPGAAAPNFDLFPPLGGGFGGLNGGRVSSVSISVNNGEITIKANEDGVKYHITAVKDDGGAQPTLIEIDDHGAVHKTDRLEKVDEQYKPMVEKLLKRIR